MNSWIDNLPTYEPGKPIETVARELGFTNIDEIIKVASNENELGPSPNAIKAMSEAASNMHRYPDGGCFYLKEKLAAMLGISSDNLIFGNGSNELIELLGHIYLSKGTNWVVSQCSFAVYHLVAALFNSAAVVAPMDSGFGHDLDGMFAKIDSNTKAIIICNPNNPTGTFLQASRLKDFLNKVPPHVVVIIDEAYIEYTDPNERYPFIEEIKNGKENLVVLRTFSKIYGLAGLRIGYAIASTKIISLCNKVRQPFNVNLMAIKAAEAALDDQQFILNAAKVNKEGLAFFESEFKRLNLPYVKSYANFILVKTMNGRTIFSKLQEKKVIVRAMDGYGLPEWIRITVGTMEQNKFVVKQLESLL